MQRQFRGIAMMLALAIAVAACATSAVNSPVTEAEARRMAESMLAAYNDGDYARWSADWSQQMKDAIGEEAFSSFRDQAMTIAGRFEQINGVEMRPSETRADAVRWEFATEFDNGAFTFLIAFHQGSKLIEGVNLEPAS